MGRFNFNNGNLQLESRTRIMGILNVTPDSFFDGGLYVDVSAAIVHAEKMMRDGADILDIGAQSTRPGHTPVTADEEWQRLEKVLRELREKITIPISVDTFYPEVAVAALEQGASIINDISGSMDNGMPAIAARYGAGLVMMHAGLGADDVGESTNTVREVRAYFERALACATKAGLPVDQICLDPGIGFGKGRQGDLDLVARLPELFRGLPPVAVLVGASRKRVIAACCEKVPSVESRLAGTLAIHTVAQWGGAHILRVHDVAEAVQAARVTDALRAASCR